MIRNMKKRLKIIASLACAVLLSLSMLLVACKGDEKKPDNNKDDDPPIEAVDYVPQLTLNLTSETKKQEVTVRQYVDGDTTHFDPLPDYTGHEFDRSEGYIKARYMAVDTPESTAQIEKWGKTASNFTQSKLESAESIIVESNDGNWNYDSTTSNRILLWVWYKPKGGSEYRNLNLEILQNGYALPSSTATSRYGDICMKALNQAKALKLHLYSPAGTVDENFYEGSAISMTLKELRCHVADYYQKTVRVQGVVTETFSNSSYIEDFDPETGLYFGMQVYFGWATSFLSILEVGNYVEIVGKISTHNDTYQISDVTMSKFNYNPETDSRVISKGNETAAQEIEPKDLNTKLTLTFEGKEDEEDETVTIDYGEAVMSTLVLMSHLEVTDVYTTQDGASKGAVTITCKAADNTVITVRTEVLKNSGTGETVTEDVYVGKTISVKGLVDKYEGKYQVRVYTFSSFTFE